MSATELAAATASLPPEKAADPASWLIRANQGHSIALASEGIHVTQLIVPGAIRDDDPVTNAPAIAENVWALHRDRDEFRRFHTLMDL